MKINIRLLVMLLFTGVFGVITSQAELSEILSDEAKGMNLSDEKEPQLPSVPASESALTPNSGSVPASLPASIPSKTLPVGASATAATQVQGQDLVSSAAVTKTPTPEDSPAKEAPEVEEATRAEEASSTGETSDAELEELFSVDMPSGEEAFGENINFLE